MAKNIFVSYNFNDRDVAKTVKRMIQKDNLDGEIVFVENDVSYNGDTAINWEIERTMADCDAALFVLGDDPRNSPWIEKEAAHALAKEIPVLATQLPNTQGKTPKALTESEFVYWDSKTIVSSLNRC